MTDLNEWLKERRLVRATPSGSHDDVVLIDAYDAILPLLTAVEKVLALHRPREVGFFSSARMLGAEKECYACNREYPCATVRAIEGATNEH